MSWFLSMVMTRRGSLISFTVLILGLFELRPDFRAELVDIDGNVGEIDELVLVDGDDEARLVDFLYGLRLGDVDFDAGLEDRSGDHENDEQHKNNVDERDHVDLGERALRVFGELRHGIRKLKVES